MVPIFGKHIRSTRHREAVSEPEIEIIVLARSERLAKATHLHQWASPIEHRGMHPDQVLAQEACERLGRRWTKGDRRCVSTVAYLVGSVSEGGVGILGE